MTNTRSNKYQWLIPWLGFLLLVPSVIINILLFQKSKLVQGTYLVTQVKDGDTFETQDRSIIRFDTLDAPELQFCGGEQAKKALEKLVLGKRVRLDSQARDPNGRQIASVWSGNTWIDAELIKTGWVAYSSSTVDKDHILQNLDYANRDAKKGIYSSLCTQTENPDNPKCLIKGNIVGEWTNKGQKIYHYPGCIQYKTTMVERYLGEEWFCTEKEAKAAGYIKSGGCKSPIKK